mmetsp:Transcript_46367/g.83686  ORF Transcript_46367/g.83686 Transcript_46367/m.83686 type:complete len:150 (+) Transcript_46367:111-560(+)|eukprot:CAMPEP_0197626080 /NCGR_PEP_ID=MMETSP1338-20131121/5218_1 /TAXON_ID=43686 ORGANISM="Pelagodinium beii, Strain RCC1491" /NCGR_SAMPLE_ID=MMETSP1338 /ASSEMBLY_ACC=CAM_ASM_000754 /LENGTH=149 /DNA_ID=CAMNT_0043196597 /DNA_START=85 /DNA_END=534 /DNA_ORIENTATION=-
MFNCCSETPTVVQDSESPAPEVKDTLAEDVGPVTAQSVPSDPTPPAATAVIEEKQEEKIEAETFVAEVPSGPLGMKADCDEGQPMTIKSVNPGSAMEKWNNDNQGKVVPGCILLDVNGKAGTGPELQKVLADLKKEGTALKLTFQTPGK